MSEMKNAVNTGRRVVIPEKKAAPVRAAKPAPKPVEQKPRRQERPMDPRQANQQMMQELQFVKGKLKEKELMLTGLATEFGWFTADVKDLMQYLDGEFLPALNKAIRDDERYVKVAKALKLPGF